VFTIKPSQRTELALRKTHVPPARTDALQNMDSDLNKDQNASSRTSQRSQSLDTHGFESEEERMLHTTCISLTHAILILISLGDCETQAVLDDDSNNHSAQLARRCVCFALLNIF
jgi:hypothetical protein